MNISITLRPRIETFKKYLEKIDDIEGYLRKRSSHYIIGFEKGSGSEVNHFQIHLEFDKKVRSNNFRKSLLTVLHKISYMDNDKVGLVVKSVVKDKDYHKGYCLKEQGKVLTDYNQEDQDRFLKTYLINVKKNDYDNKNYFKVNKKNIHIQVKRYIIENNIEEYQYDRSRVKEIMSEMVLKDYYIPHIIEQKNGSMVIDRVWYYLNRDGKSIVDVCDIVDDKD